MVGHDITKGDALFSPYRYRGQLYSIIYGQAIPSVIGQKSVALTPNLAPREVWNKCKAGLKQLKLPILAPRGVRDMNKAGLKQPKLLNLAPRGMQHKYKAELK